jgi:putative ABC transport system substrate-binding protein
MHILQRLLALGAAVALLVGRPGLVHAQAQPAPVQIPARPAKPPLRVGVINGTNATVGAPMVAALREGLEELGYVEGQTIVTEWRYLEGRLENAPTAAEDLVQSGVAAIISGNPAGVQAAHAADPALPVIMAAATESDKARSDGFIDSLDHPGGTITGVVFANPEQRKLELLRVIVPGAERVAVLLDAAFLTPAIRAFYADQSAATGVQFELVPIARGEDLDGAWATVRQAHVQALSVGTSPLLASLGARIAQLAAQERLPAIYSARQYAEAGGLLSYGVDFAGAYRRAAAYVDRIARGAAPGELPVDEAPGELVVNQRAAEALGLTMPTTLVTEARAILR